MLYGYITFATYFSDKLFNYNQLPAIINIKAVNIYIHIFLKVYTLISQGDVYMHFQD